MKIIKDEEGFSVIETVIVVVVVAALIFAGWYVYNSNKVSKNKDTPMKVQNLQKPADKTEAKSTDLASSWLLYKPPGSEYEIRIPDGWKLERYQSSSSVYSLDSSDISYIKGTTATVTEVQGGKDFSTVSFSLSIDKNTELPNTDAISKGVKQTSLTTTQGLVIDKYYFLTTTEPDIMGPPKGTKLYTYRVTKGNYSITVNHDVLDMQTDDLTYLEKSIQTIKFLN